MEIIDNQPSRLLSPRKLTRESKSGTAADGLPRSLDENSVRTTCSSVDQGDFAKVSRYCEAWLISSTESVFLLCSTDYCSDVDLIGVIRARLHWGVRKTAESRHQFPHRSMSRDFWVKDAVHMCSSRVYVKKKIGDHHLSIRHLGPYSSST